jgi:hypothetical protein
MMACLTSSSRQLRSARGRIWYTSITEFQLFSNSAWNSSALYQQIATSRSHYYNSFLQERHGLHLPFSRTSYEVLIIFKFKPNSASALHYSDFPTCTWFASLDVIPIDVIFNKLHPHLKLYSTIIDTYTP